MPKITDNAIVGLSDQHIHYLDNAHGIHHNVVDAWQTMQSAAQDDGFELRLVSSFRTFEQQCKIWDRKFTGQTRVLDINEREVDLLALTNIEKVKAIMLFSALPGSSRHHWGTDIDVYAPNLLPQHKKLQLEVWEYQEQGPMYPLTLWLKENANRFGFFFPYDKYRGGISHEPWHLSFAPIAQSFQNDLTTDLLSHVIANSEISGKTAVLENIELLFEQFITNIGAYPQ